MKKKWDYSEEMFSRLSGDRLILMRNYCLGSAAATLLILIGAYQVGVRDVQPLLDWLSKFDGWLPDGFPWDTAGGNLAVFGAAIALPFWIALSGAWEYYVFLGEEYFADLSSKWFQLYVAVVMLVAAIGSYVAVGGMLMHLGKTYFAVFAWTSGAALVTFLIFHAVFILRHRANPTRRAAPKS